MHMAEKEASIQTDSQCCVCFEEYEEEEEWIQCTCTRWLHRDCVIDIVQDANGPPRMCPYCLV